MRASFLLILVTMPVAFESGAHAAQYSFSSMQFTPCGATGANGPSLANCLAQSNYTSRSWTSNTSYFNVVNGIQYWTVPTTGDYQITAAGAQGGSWGSNQGGKGVIETSTISLTEGQIIRILVGQKGGNSDGTHGSGGGGTFVIASPYDTNTAILMIAGGGGGYGAQGGGANMQGQTARNPTSSSGNAGSNGGGGASAANTSGGGNGFNPGANAGQSLWASGGGGFGGNGGAYNGTSLAGGKSFTNGGAGGAGSTTSGVGGFGGGGGAGDRGAGGGGYSGGGGGNLNTVGGDGGGSYITGTNQQAVGGINSGDGYVLITRYVSAQVTLSVPTTANYRNSVTATLDSDSPGRTTFYANGKKIAGCISVAMVGSSSSYSIQCTWKPTTRGVIVLTAIESPSNGNLVTKSSANTILVANRVGTR